MDKLMADVWKWEKGESVVVGEVKGNMKKVLGLG
jgi:hypothetical protein